jgi:hypothetical protein
MWAAPNSNLKICVLVLAALFFLVMGIAGFIAPAFVARQFQVKDLTITGRNEVRAVYGGFGVATVVALVCAVFDTGARNGITFAVIAASSSSTPSLPAISSPQMLPVLANP